MFSLLSDLFLLAGFTGFSFISCVQSTAALCFGVCSFVVVCLTTVKSVLFEEDCLSIPIYSVIVMYFKSKLAGC